MSSVAPFNPGLQALLETLARLHPPSTPTESARSAPQKSPPTDRVELSPEARRVSADNKTPAGR
ncbi:MAG TPA: hypothetical protein VFA04_18165 [Bryobacteraceae bacterium]|nr:hypothetical protein [Bryobacteraceae bacterium]